MIDLGSVNGRVISKANKEGVSAVETFSVSWRSKSAYIEDSMPNFVIEDKQSGIGVKVAIGKKVGFSSSSLEKEEDALAALDAAIKIARLSPDDAHFESFPPIKEVTGSVDGVYDGSIPESSSADLMDKAMIVVESATATKDMEVPKGMIRAQDYEFKISNSTGLENGHKGTILFLSFSSKIAAGGNSGEGIEKAYSTELKGIDFESIGEKISSRAVNTLDAIPFKGKFEAPAIIANSELGQMLLSSLGYAISGENVNKKRSPWIDKIGSKMFSETLNIMDDPLLPGGIQSAPIDDEGSPAVRKTIVEKGVLKRFIYDHYNAQIAQQEGGNGFRRGVGTIEKSHFIPASCSVSNLTIPPGDKGLDEMISELDKGILVEKFAAPEVNQFSGAFGLEVRNASIIEKGEIKEYVKFALLSGNLFESLGKVLMIGNDNAIGGPWMITSPGAAYCPSVTFEGFQLVGQE
ncbi:MAG: TldD/PmbA family protein [Methanobacteriota archaeon]|nr:MAG: TldD/PmbA family protein [Euryarchaeota archaeon]